MRHLGSRFAFCAGAAVLCAVSGCIVVEESAGETDTVLVRDTVHRVDPVALRDTMVALGGDTAEIVPGFAGPVSDDELDELRRRRLVVPVAGVAPGMLRDTFEEMRGSRRHAALDIMATRGTPVIAADAGTVAKLHTSVGGGLTIYVFDPTERFSYYYAHLDRYHPRIAEGSFVGKGDTIGFVGSTGNASADAPHLHFAIARLGPDKQWWAGTPIDPRPLLIRAGANGE